MENLDDAGRPRVDNQDNIEIIFDKGTARATVLIAEKGSEYGRFFQESVEALSKNSPRTVCLTTPLVTDSSWRETAELLFKKIAILKIRNASYIVGGGASALVQFLALKHPKLVRSIFFIDVTCRPHPSWWHRTVDRIEQSMPLGLPLRLNSEAFDAKPFLHRVRCPVLVASWNSSSEYEKAQADVIAAEIPTAWRVMMGQNNIPQFLSLVEEFGTVQAKCPQKNVNNHAKS